MKILSVFGTRPEAVKMAPVVQRLARTPGMVSRVCITAQHRQMLDQVLNLFGIQPDYDLDLMRDDQSLAELSAAIFTHLDPVFAEFKPDWALVQGDTTTVAIASLLAFYHRIKVGHVEAGLRTHDKWQPFPEEINRRVAGVVADLHFAPTGQARENLLREGIPDETIVVTGNPVIDALQFVAERPAPQEIEELLEKLEIASPSANTSSHLGNDREKKLILVTAHRRENFGRPLENICLALKELAKRGDVEIVYPVHLNPNVQEPVKRILGNIPHVTLLPPLDYLPLVHLQKRAKIILTDSGGIQEEAPAFGVPVLVLREVTERPEGVAAGTLKLVGTEAGKIVREAKRLLDDPSAHAKMAKAANPFGDGHAAERIVEALKTIKLS
ncbi:MAG: UDP-N-acetylglucosamine 2-epimerase (non-hydrolyzing) [Anaerolineales bacterium]|nr:UDP-N-acetylglucosamine 2-epimerase (non-hydrolyzing) [Anaerolineales bacterium]